MSDEVERRGHFPTPSLRAQLCQAMAHSDAHVAATLMLEAFEAATGDDQIALLQEDPVWLQRNVRSVLDELDERRTDMIMELKRALVPPLDYLLLT